MMSLLKIDFSFASLSNEALRFIIAGARSGSKPELVLNIGDLAEIELEAREDGRPWAPSGKVLVDPGVTAGDRSAIGAIVANLIIDVRALGALAGGLPANSIDRQDYLSVQEFLIRTWEAVLTLSYAGKPS
jgi:hypothetical protein